MLWLALLFLLIAFIAALFGFGVIASAAADIAVIIFWVFLALLVISVLSRLLRR